MLNRKLNFSPKSLLSSALIPFISLVLLWVFFLSNALTDDRSFGLWIDNEFFLGTVLNSIENSIRNFEIPLRMDNLLGGIPIYNLTQLSPLYPFYFTIFPLFNEPADVIRNFHLITLFHLLVFEVNTYIFLRVNGVSKLSALTGAALLTFSANSFAYASWINTIAPYSWLPLYLAGFIGTLNFPNRKRYLIMALVGIVLLTLASPAQPVIHAVFVTIIFCCAYSLSRFHKNRVREIPKALTTIAIIGGLAMLLTAPAIFPAMLEFEKMIRWVGPFPPVVGNSPIPFEAFHLDQVSISELGGVFFKFKGHAVGNPFTGVIVIALACISLFSQRKTWITYALAFIGAYALLSSAGTNLGFAYLNYEIPLLNKIREPSRFLVLFQFAVCLLAASGIDELRRMTSATEKSSNEKYIWTILIAIPLIALTVLYFVNQQIVSTVSPFVSFIFLLILVILTWLAINRFKSGRVNKTVIILWAVAALIILKIEVPWIPPSVADSEYVQIGGSDLDSAIQRVAALDPARNYRVIFDGKVKKQQAAMLASYRNVRTLNSYFNPVPKDQFDGMYYHAARGDNYFRILGAKYLICQECEESVTKGYNFLEKINGYDIYETEDVLPRVFVAKKAGGDFSNLADFAGKAANNDLQKRILYLEQGEKNPLASSSDASDGSCIQAEEFRSSNRSRYTVQCQVPGIIVMNEFYDDGWKAVIDRLETKPLRVNGTQIGVPFAAGSHTIEFRYSPDKFVSSIVLMFIGLALTIVFLIRKK